MEKVNIAQKFSLFDEHWSPRIAGELNDSYVKLAKLKGEFVWHHHDEEDELFLVVKGRLLIKLRDGDVWLDEGEFVVIPKGVEWPSRKCTSEIAGQHGQRAKRADRRR